MNGMMLPPRRQANCPTCCLRAITKAVGMGGIVNYGCTNNHVWTVLPEGTY